MTVQTEYAVQAMVDGLVESIGLPATLELLIQHCQVQAQAPDTGKKTPDGDRRVASVRKSWRDAALILDRAIDDVKKTATL